MGSFYRLQIQCDVEGKAMVESILGKSNDSPELDWGFIIEEDSPDFVNALDLFIELITQNRSLLEGIGVAAGSITFWYMYEYDQQCNMEFSPNITKQIGELGITLCISCWEK